MRAPAPDFAVLGAGPVGLCFALAAHAAGRTVVVLEQRARSAAPAHPARPIALSHASRLILERVGAWRGLGVTPLETIHVSQANGPGRTVLEARDVGVPALGYVVAYDALERALLECAARCALDIVHDVSIARREHESGALRLRGSCNGQPWETMTRCLVHAEGLSAEAREKRYPQEAVVGLIDTDPPAATTAFERFTPEGPLALLPMAGRYALVWAARPDHAAELAEGAQDAFLAALGRMIGARAGRLLAAEQRTRVPLALRVRASRLGAREVFIGNAAQTLHPVAGQGLNLGLRDAWDLAWILRDVADPGDSRALARYASRRRLDAAATIRVTDLLAGAFLGDAAILRWARGGALAALDTCAPARRFFARRMIFGLSALP